jgi:hypothetical protein
MLIFVFILVGCTAQALLAIAFQSLFLSNFLGDLKKNFLTDGVFSPNAQESVQAAKRHSTRPTPLLLASCSGLIQGTPLETILPVFALPISSIRALFGRYRGSQIVELPCPEISWTGLAR